MGGYIKQIRQKVGHKCIILVFAAAIVKNTNGEILLQKRGDKKAWGFPGGAIEIGESAEEAVIREVKEETGIHVKVDKLIGVYTKYFDEYQNSDKAQTIVIFFECSMLNGELNADNDETIDLKFYKKEEAPKLFNEQHQDVFNDYIRNKFGVFR